MATSGIVYITNSSGISAIGNKQTTIDLAIDQNAEINIQVLPDKYSSAINMIGNGHISIIGNNNIYIIIGTIYLNAEYKIDYDM